MDGLFPLPDGIIREHYKDYLVWCEKFPRITPIDYEQFHQECQDSAPGFLPPVIAWDRWDEEGNRYTHHKTIHRLKPQ